MGSEMCVVSAERDILKRENEVMAMENCTLREQVVEVRGARQGVKEHTKVWNKTVKLLTSENENLKKELEEASVKE